MSDALLTRLRAVETRVMVFGAIAALLGLPVVVAAGLLLHLRRLENYGRRATA